MEFPKYLIEQVRKLRALVLDMDGVLVDTEPLHIEAFRRYLKKHGLPHDDAYIFGFIGFSVPDNMRSVYRKFYRSTDETEIAKAVRERDAIYLQLLRERPLRPLPGMEELIGFCREHHIPIGLASSSDWEQIHTIFENLVRSTQGRFDPQAVFKAVLSGQEVPQRKPHPEIYRRIVRMLEVEPGQAMAIEDSPAGVQSAKEAGLLCLALKSKFIDPQKLEKADLILNDAREALALCRRALQS